MKVCSKCKVEKDEGEFSKKASSKDGLKPNCKSCDSYYRNTNIERHLEQSLNYRRKHREEIRLRDKAYRLNHKKPSEVICLPDGTKICSKCKQLKSKQNFTKKSSEKDGLYNQCKECVWEYNNSVDGIKSKKEWKRINAIRLSSERRLKRSSNPEITKLDNERRRLHKKEKPELCRATVAARRAAKLNATVTFVDKTAVNSLFKQAKDLSDETGEMYQVDHIVPLIHPLVCGLHWEGNLQVITAEENLKKSNKYWPDMPDTLEYEQIKKEFEEFLTRSEKSC